jgi:YfiR/HmsC-like
MALAWSGPAFAQGTAADEATVKAGFVFNFIKFTQWPPVRTAPGAPLYLCTLSDTALPGALELLQGRQVSGRPVEVRRRVPPAEWRQCDVVFLGDGDAAARDGVFRQLGSAPVLTVGDLPGFVATGGMIGLRIESDRVRFDVNLAVAQRNGLGLSSQMLQLAGQVVR